MSKPDSKERLKSWLRRQRRIEWDQLSRGDQESILRTSYKIDKRVGRPVRKVTGRIGTGMHNRAPKGRVVLKKKIKDGVRHLFLGGAPRRRRRVK